MFTHGCCLQGGDGGDGTQSQIACTVALNDGVAFARSWHKSGSATRAPAAAANGDTHVVYDQHCLR